METNIISLQLVGNDFLFTGFGGKQPRKVDFGLNKETQLNITALLQYLITFKFCSGIENTEHINTVVRNQEKEDKCILININGVNSWVSLNCIQSPRIRSPVHCANSQGNTLLEERGIQ